MSDKGESMAMAVNAVSAPSLIEAILRARIFESLYWKEQCFGLTAETLVEKAAMLDHAGGQTMTLMPTQFLCLTLKLLQMQPTKDIVLTYLHNEDFKYLRALAAFYIRLVASAKDVYQYLEPLLNDYRKLRMHSIAGTRLSYMDEFVDQLLHEERACDVILPRLPKRHVLEDLDELEPRVSVLEEMLESSAESEGDHASDSDGDGDGDHPTADEQQQRQLPASPSSPPPAAEVSSKRSRSRSRSRTRAPELTERHQRRERSVDRGRRHRSRSRSPDQFRERRYSRSRSRDRRDHYDSRRSSRYDRSRSRSPRRHRSSPQRRDREASGAIRTARAEGEANLPLRDAMDVDLPESTSQTKAAFSKKKVDKLFKKGSQSRRKESEPATAASSGSNGGGAQESLSIEETNKLRASLGLAPLK
ncbi:hypothetical protein RI367_000775 [Sorochytrium milnesiophthora]